MSRLALKRFACFFLPFIACYLLFSLLFYLSDIYSKRFGDLFSRLAGPEVSVNRVFLSPFEGMILKDVQFRDHSGRAIFMKQVTLVCSLSDLLKKKLRFTKIMVDDLHMDIHQDQNAPSWNNLPDLIKKRQTASDAIPPWRDDNPKDRPLTKKQAGFELRFDKTLLCFHNARVGISPSNEGEKKKWLVLDVCLDSQGNKIHCTGRADYNKSSLLNQMSGASYVSVPYLNFLLDIEPIGTDILVDQVKIDGQQYFLAGTGIIRDAAISPKLDLRIYSSPIRLEEISFLKSLHLKGGELGIVGNLTGSFDDLNLYSEWVMPTIEIPLEKDILKLDQLFCHFNYRFKTHGLNIKEFAGIIDESQKFSMTGEINNILSPFLNVRCELTKPLSTASIRDGDPKGRPLTKDSPHSDSVLINLAGNLERSRFLGNANFIYSNSTDRQYFVAFKDFVLSKDATREANSGFMVEAAGLNLSEQMITGQEKKILQSFDFRDVDARIKMFGKRMFVNSLAMSGYNGRVLLKGSTYFNKGMHECLLSIHMENLDLKDIKLTYPVYCEISGITSGDIEIQSQREAEVRGFVTANHFKIARLGPLDKIADFIGINSIKEIDNAQIALDFDLSAKNSLIHRFDLDSEKMWIRSGFKINSQNWLESEVALSLPRAVMEESKMFKTLLATARERNNLLDFVVHVSGFLWQLRTELVKSDFRDKLKEQVSVSVQKYIEKEANKAINDTQP